MSIARNSSYALAGTVLPLLVSIATIPIFVETIGAARYGALSISWLLLAYFGQADFGVGRAVTQRVAAIGPGDPKHLAQVVLSALAMICAISVAIGFLVYGVAGWYFSGPFEISRELRPELIASVGALALCAPVVAISGVFSGVLAGLERFGLISSVNFVSSVMIQVVPLVVALTLGPDLTLLVLASLFSRLVLLVVFGIAAWYSVLRGQRAAPSAREMRRLGGYGSWVVIGSIVGPIMGFSDRLLIGSALGAVAVTAYAIPAMIAMRLQIIPVTISSTLFPRFAAESAAAASSRYRDYAVFMGQLLAPVVIGLICLAGPLLAAWLGAELDPRSILVGQIILAGAWPNGIAQVSLVYIQARENPRFTALLGIAELPLYFALLFGLGGLFGLAGYAAAYSVRCLFDAAILMWRAGSYDRVMLGRLVPPAVLVTASLLVGPWLTGWLEALAAAAVLGSASVAAMLLQMPPKLRQQAGTLPLADRFPLIARYAASGGKAG